MLVHLPAAPMVERVMDVAMPLARRFDAHLTGFHVVPPLVIYASPMDGIPPEIYAAQEVELEAEADRVRGAFHARLGTHPGKWLVVSARAESAVGSAIDICRTAELVITPQFDPSRGGPHVYLPQDLIMESGRPVLVVPSAGRFEDVGRQVVIAWNNSRESARAAIDALAVMGGGARVTILQIAEDGALSDATLASGERLALALTRHGMEVEVQTADSGDATVGEVILSRAVDREADLIVMGCYGHSRVGEFVFGGATHTLLHHMTVPVLMSH
jgi:nucleotide-binding universal stress UspA family protein